MDKVRTHWLLIALLAVAATPAIFLFFAIQYSALTYPFWDHCEIVKFFVKYYEGHLSLSDLWSPHNHTRPLTYRLIVIGNGILTDWDIRSEFVYLMIQIYAAFGVLAYALWRVMDRKSDVYFAAALVLLSIFSFSPVGHNNHWWSMMMQLDLAHLFIVAALVSVAFRPQSWWTTCLACLSCWLATYTLTNGLFAFMTCCLVTQITSRKPLRPSPLALFWLVNLVVCLIIYLPGLPESPATLARPTLLTGIKFILAYLGAPLAFLIQFPFRGIFEESPTIRLTAPTGAFLLSVTGAVCYRFRARLQRLEPSGLLFISFASVALLSAAATAVGRAAFSANGAAAANASRYSLFGNYLVFAIVFFLAPLLRGFKPSVPVRTASTFCFLLFVGFAAHTYHYSKHLYRDAHEFNKLLSRAFAPGAIDNPDNDRLVYPNPEFVSKMRTDLKRLKIGPYRGISL